MSASRLASRCRLCPSIAGALACVFSTAGKEGDDDDDAEDEGVVVVVCDSGAGGFELLRPLFFCFRALFRSSLSPLPRSCSTSSSSESMSISARLLLFQSQGRMKAEQGTSRKETKGAKQGEREGAKKQRRCCCLLPFLALLGPFFFFFCCCSFLFQNSLKPHKAQCRFNESFSIHLGVVAIISPLDELFLLFSFLLPGHSALSSNSTPPSTPTQTNTHTHTHTHTNTHTQTRSLTQCLGGLLPRTFGNCPFACQAWNSNQPLEAEHQVCKTSQQCMRNCGEREREGGG